MKKFMLMIAVLFCFLFSGFSVFASDISFTWTPNTGDTTGYKLVMDSGDNVILDLPGIATSTATVAVEDNKCHTYAIFAYNDVEVSLLSDFAMVCPKKPKKISSFIIITVPK